MKADRGHGKHRPVHHHEEELVAEVEQLHRAEYAGIDVGRVSAAAEESQREAIRGDVHRALGVHPAIPHGDEVEVRREQQCRRRGSEYQNCARGVDGGQGFPGQGRRDLCRHAQIRKEPGPPGCQRSSKESIQPTTPSPTTV